MNGLKVGAAAAAVLSVAGLLTACGKDSATEESPVAFSPVTGDQYTANPGAFQTDGVAVPPKSVMMVGDPVAAQAVVNSGLPQATITSTSNNTTVYYPPVPADALPPDIRPAPQPPVPEPLARPANTRPWQYTPRQIDAYRTICDTGRWGSWIAGPEYQTQVCWSVYGRQLGVRPWVPGQPRPWDRPGYPRPWFDPGFRADVPVMWIYPRGWTQPRPQPIISVSITINIGTNPYRRVNPRFGDPFFPVWAVTPGRPVDVCGQDMIVAPVYTSTTTTTTTVISAPVAPGVVLAPLPTSAKIEPILALPGARIPGNVNINPTIVAPVAAALDGAVIQAGSRAEVEAAVGTSVKVSVANPSSAPTTTATTAAADTAGRGSTGTTAPGTGTATAPGTGAATSPAQAPAPSGARAGDPGTPAGGTTVPTTSAAPGAPSPTVPALIPTTTLAPPITTVAPVPTTVAPVPTTVAPVPITVPVPTRTVAPVPTTTVPVPTRTVAPVPTTTVPIPTTTVPVPVPTREIPIPIAPRTTVQAPVTTTTVAPAT
ncbi:hypothetical protein FK529_12630 [Tsukamurella asaccharolytica]|uniref:PASTA domain-containing protein n=1 Tax=Tsukamurella asaccharolytica TaxID=2592067 RepID=A0A5C5R784_9ACTN|nr:hypothetical protein [Tsukamurella asaccharolytica]TWS18830.1 hypothetical protein FK529_12630 [Tsukamurella asaccharolytica]